MRVKDAVAVALGTALLVALAYQRPVVFGTDTVGAQDLEGFGRRGVSQGRPWRFTGTRARIRFPLAGQVLPGGARLRVDLGLPVWASTHERQVTLALDGRAVGLIDVEPGFGSHEFTLKGERRSTGDWVLTLTTGGGELDPPDSRGVALVEAELVQTSGVVVPALRTWLLAVLGVLSIWTFLEPRLTRRASLLCALAAAGGSSLGLAFARPQVALVVSWLGVASILISVIDALRRGLPPPVATRVSAFAPALGLLALVAGATGRAPLMWLVVALCAVGLTRTQPVPVAEPEPSTKASREWLVVLALLAVALGFRIFRLEEIPFALFRDEARHGLLALRLLEDTSYRPLFLGQPINQPLPYFLAVAAAIRAFGANLFALRIVSAVAGALVVPLLYGLVREVLGRREALVAALLLAASSWHVSISRFAVNYVEPSLFSLPAYWVLWRALPRARLPGLCLAALLVGLGQYSAHTAKALLVVTVGLVTEALARRVLSGDKAGFRKLVGGLSLAAVVGLVTLAPLILFMLANPDDYLSRAQQVSIWNHAAAEGESWVRPLFQNLSSYAGAFHVVGDVNGRHHLPRAALLDPLAGLGLLVGLGLALTRLASRPRGFLLLWLLAGLLPGLLTVDAPSALRTIESAPAVYAVAALGLVTLWDSRLHPAMSAWRVVPVLVLAFSVAWNAWIYFVRMYRSPEVWMSSAVMGTPLGKRLRELRLRGLLPEQSLLAVPRRFWEEPDDPEVLRFFWPRGLKVGVYDDPVPLTKRADAILVPNDAELWRRAAFEDPRNTARFTEAAAEQARWRERLGSALRELVVAGPPFPGADQPAFWLYLPAAEGR